MGLCESEPVSDHPYPSPSPSQVALKYRQFFICSRVVLKLGSQIGEWHGLAVSEEACHSKGRGFESLSFPIFFSWQLFEQLRDETWRWPECIERSTTRRSHEDKGGSGDKRWKDWQANVEWTWERIRLWLRNCINFSQRAWACVMWDTKVVWVFSLTLLCKIERTLINDLNI